MLTMDLDATHAGHLPVTVICELFGVPHCDRERVKVWFRQLTGPVTTESFELMLVATGDEATTNLIRDGVLALVCLPDQLLGGQVRTVGDLVHLVLAAANRDPDRFDDPDQLDLTPSRQPASELRRRAVFLSECAAGPPGSRGRDGHARAAPANVAPGHQDVQWRSNPMLAS